MLRGLILGLIIGFALIVAGLSYEWKTGKRLMGPGVQEKIAELDSSTLDMVRNTPEQVFLQAKDENLPAFLAFLDMDVTVTDAAVKEYASLINTVSERYGKVTRKEVVGAALEISSAKQYYHDLSQRQSLQYLLDAAPAAGSTQSVSVRQTAQEIHSMLMTEYFRPQVDAMAQQQAERAAIQQSIRDNAVKARERGAARDAARAQSQQGSWMNQQMDMYWRDYQNRFSNNQYYHYNY